MNQRIKELAERADILFYQGRIPETGFEYEGAEVTVEDLKKFAELLIKECISEIHMVDVGNLKGRSYYIDKVAEHLEKHFGVEQC